MHPDRKDPLNCVLRSELCRSEQANRELIMAQKVWYHKSLVDGQDVVVVAEVAVDVAVDIGRRREVGPRLGEVSRRAVGVRIGMLKNRWRHWCSLANICWCIRVLRMASTNFSIAMLQPNDEINHHGWLKLVTWLAISNKSTLILHCNALICLRHWLLEKVI